MAQKGLKRKGRAGLEETSEAEQEPAQPGSGHLEVACAAWKLVPWRVVGWPEGVGTGCQCCRMSGEECREGNAKERNSKPHADLFVQLENLGVEVRDQQDTRTVLLLGAFLMKSK